MPAVVVFVWDVIHRHGTYAAMLHVDAVALIVTWLLSATMWTCAMVASTRRRGAVKWIARVVIAILGAITALQAFSHEYFATMIDAQLLQNAWQLEGMASLARPFLWTIVRWMSAGAIASLAWSFVVARLAKTKPRAARRASLGMFGALIATLIGASFMPHVSADAAPDVLALGAVGRVALDHSKHGGTASFVAIPDVNFPRTVPPVASAHARVHRNVIFVLTESVRASAYCSAYRPECPYSPFSNAALPDRFPLERMRSVDSVTLLSFGVMFAGLSPTSPKSDWLTAPLLFDYAHAAGMGTAYWSAQNAYSENAHDWTDHEPIDRLATGTDFDPKADELLGADDVGVVDRAITELPQLREPFFAVVHFSATHYPYRIDSDAPFRPIGGFLDPRAPQLARNRYFDAIYRQDKSTAKLVKAVRAMPLGAHTVIVFTSDHGESFYEHEAAALHGSSLWDQEIRVPAWIDAPSGLLSQTEISSLRDARDAPVTAEDIAPTLLDLLGLYDVDAWHDFTAKMIGASLLRSPARDRTTDIATCNELWPCPRGSSGKLIGDFKWVMRPHEPYRCFDTRSDPDETRDLGAKACGQ